MILWCGRQCLEGVRAFCVSWKRVGNEYHLQGALHVLFLVAKAAFFVPTRPYSRYLLNLLNA